MAVPRINREYKPGTLYRWGAFAVRNKWKVLGAWLVSMVLFGVISTAVGDEFSDRFTLPGADSQEAYDLLEERFPSQSGETGRIVFQARTGAISDPAVQGEIQALLDTVRGLPHVVDVESPLDRP
jgi:RND superfamily putative drug exporter